MDAPNERAMGARFMSFAFASADLLLEVNPRAGVITFAMGAATGLTDASDRELVGRPWTTVIHPHDHAYVDTLIGTLAIGSRCGPVTVRLAAASEDGTPRQGVFSACRLPGDNDRIACTLSRPTPSVAASSGTRSRDADSQLLERDSFGDVVAEIAGTATARPVSLTLLDMPGLALLQQRLPAETMSELIRGVGAVLRTASVAGDAAGRVSDTRFGLLQDDGAANLPARIADLTRRIDPAGEGVAVQRADIALGSGQLAPDEAIGAIRYVINSFADRSADAPMPTTLSSAFETMVQDTVARMSRFSETVRQDDFTIAYQPIVDLETRAIKHFEVLARFKDGESPFETIRFAEQVGIIEEFDLGVCLRAIRQLEAPGCDSRLSLAVNISGKSIESAVFVRCLTELLDKHHDLASRVMLEITESAELRDLTQVDRVVQAIRRRGFTVCLDDFGAGAASFQYLQALTIDYVKIDGAYVKRLGKSVRDDAMMKGIAQLCRDLDIKTVAEMVETQEQASQLRAMGVQFGQGYLFGRPEAQPALPAQVTRLARRRGSTETWG